jgi:hypothetical protein
MQDMIDEVEHVETELAKFTELAADKRRVRGRMLDD